MRCVAGSCKRRPGSFRARALLGTLALSGLPPAVASLHRSCSQASLDFAPPPRCPELPAIVAPLLAAARFWDTRSSKNTATVSTPGSNLYMAWSPDSHHVAVGNREDVVSIVDTR